MKHSPPSRLRRPGIAGWALLAAICLAVVGADLTLAHRSEDYALGGVPRQSLPAIINANRPYNLLVRGLERGHVSLDRPVPPGLERLPDPYDSEANGLYRDKYRLFDLSYYRGRLYLYFGITPALTAFLPWHLLTGSYLSEWLAVGGFSALGFLASAGLLVSVWRLCFAGVGAGAVAACLLILATATTVPLIVARPRFWEVPVSSSYAFAMLAIASGWFACRRARGQAAWLALAGLSSGLVVGSRPNLLPSALGIAAAAAVGAALCDPNPRRTRRLALTRCVVVAFLPLVLVGIGLGAYNFERFGNPFQFGQHYQLSSDTVHGQTLFSAAYLLDNLRLYGFSALRWGPHFPFAWTPDTSGLSPKHGTVEFVVGLVPNLPVLLLALAAPLAWRGRPEPEARALRGLGAVLAVLFVVQAAILGVYYAICSRYEIDFLPFLALLACLGLLGVARTLPALRPLVRRTLSTGIGLLCAYSCLAVACATLAWGDCNRWWNLSQILLSRGDLAGARSACDDEIRISNGNKGYADLADLEKRAGRTAEAIDAFSESLRRDPRDWVGRTNFGVVLEQAGRMADALQQFREANRIHPGSTAIELNLGLVLLRLDRPDAAVTYLAAAVRRDPDNGLARQWLDEARGLVGRSPQEDPGPAPAPAGGP